MLQFVVIKVSKDNNLMYLFYTKEIAFSVDSTNPNLLLECLQRKFTNTFYLPEEISNLPKIDIPRKLIYSFTTHHHFDHSGGDKLLKELLPDILQLNATNLNKKTEREIYEKTGVTIECIRTPCHTQDSICILINNKFMCTGDTIFYLGCGCFFEGTPKDMLNCINSIKKYDDHILLLYGHNYKDRNLEFIKKECPNLNRECQNLNRECQNLEFIKNERIFLTLKEEKQYNPFFQVKNEKEMGELRTKKNNFKSSF